jgi:hypothetical protein
MTFLRYLGPEARPDRQPPSRVYARVDRIEPLEHGVRPEPRPDEPQDWWVRLQRGSAVVALDSVDAEWFDRLETDARFSNPDLVDDADWHVLVVFAVLEDLPRVREGDWLELLLTGTSSPLVPVFLNLYAAPDWRTLAAANSVLPDRERELIDKTSMDDVDDAEESEIHDALAAVPMPEAAAVYDVGQGNCTAALAGSMPVLYFDFGGGVLRDLQTFPATLKAFCLTASPVFVLSHWDWDHWSSANRHPPAYDETWIVPRQGGSLGGAHLTFLGRLLQRARRLLVWRPTLPRVRAGAYELLKCTGPSSSRNDSGIALVVERVVDGTAARLLCPGDAGYQRIPGGSGSFTHVVVPHHGGQTNATSTPAPDGRTCGRLVYSYGPGNSHHHPSSAVQNLHDASWGLPKQRRTEDRNPHLGHVHLYWDDGAPASHPGCGGTHCQLTCHQR